MASERSQIKLLQSKQVLYWLLLLLLSLTWGSSYILIKKGLIAFSPTQVAGLRIGISALAFLPIFIYRFKKIDWSKWKALSIVGFAGSFFPAFLFSFAQTELSSSITGVLSSLTPLFTLLLGIIFFKIVLKRQQAMGVLLGLLGAILLVFLNKNTEEVGNVWYSLLVVLATLLYATSTNVIKTYLQEMSSITISAVSFIIIGFPAIGWLLTTNFIDVLETSDSGWTSLGYITILALAGTVMASLLFFKLVQLTSAVFASMVSYLIPIIALFWGFLDGEAISFFHIGGMLLILFGVYIARKTS